MWKHFHDKLIGMDWQQNTGILDIRYPEVREYLSKVYADAVKDWDLDGLKLDFIDEFYQRKETPAVNEQMDCACIQQALDKLLAETMERLKKKNRTSLSSSDSVISDRASADMEISSAYATVRIPESATVLESWICACSAEIQQFIRTC